MFSEKVHDWVALAPSNGRFVASYRGHDFAALIDVSSAPLLGRLLSPLEYNFTFFCFTKTDLLCLRRSRMQLWLSSSFLGMVRQHCSHRIGRFGLNSQFTEWSARASSLTISLQPCSLFSHLTLRFIITNLPSLNLLRKFMIAILTKSNWISPQIETEIFQGVSFLYRGAVHQARSRTKQSLRNSERDRQVNILRQE